MTLKIGEAVPDFSAPSTGGQFRLSEARGAPLLIYFYPKDNTSGCTAESLDFAQAHDRFAQARTRIIGVSRDSMKSHEGFKQKLQLPFELVSDPDEHLCKLFGVIKNKTMYGKPVRGIERSTFLLDGQGALRHEWRGVKVPGHVEQALAAARALG
ncbi:MAG TPA: peroxiredoxin [Burkholderiaceae bacterium]|nr:peroxiredoxin [Burkholderiaceae bacterium]